MSQRDLCEHFLGLHRADTPLLLPNPWDVGSAKVLEALGFSALATTSNAFAATLGRLDGAITRDEAIGHAATIAAATDLPVSADLENGFGHEPSSVAETIDLAIGAGLAGCSIEDFTGDADDPIYDIDAAEARVRAAADAAHAGPVHLVLTARAENHLHGRNDLDDTIERLLRYQEAGADVLYAPGLATLAGIERILDAVDLPLNVLARPGVPPVAELAELGVARVSVGGGFGFAALDALIDAATELRDQGTYTYADKARHALGFTRKVFTDPR